MRGSTARQVTMLALVDPDQLIPTDHPIRDVKPVVEEALKELEPVFADMYSEVGRHSIPPEHLLRACLLMAFYSIRSERQFCERLRYEAAVGAGDDPARRTYRIDKPSGRRLRAGCDEGVADVPGAARGRRMSSRVS